MSYQELEMKVVQWGEARGIVQHGTPLGQATKTLEEAGELVEATAGYQAINYFDAENVEALSHYKNKAVDAVGDVIVTLIMVCATMDLDLTSCLNVAYNEIKDRKGYLRADGVFVKQA